MHKYRIGCFIDSLNSGGAQRQLCLLAKLLKKRNYEVFFYVYKNLDFYKYLLDEDCIPVRYILTSKKSQRIPELAQNIRADNLDALIAYLKTPSLIAELSKVLKRNCALIVSERSIDAYSKKRTRYIHQSHYVRFAFHSLANAVVANSDTQSTFIKSKAPWLRNRVVTIHNCVDVGTFMPQLTALPKKIKEINLLVLGRYEWEKNPMNLLMALKLVKKRHPEINLRVDWYGNNFVVDGVATKKAGLYFRLKDSISKNNLNDSFRLHLAKTDVVPLYQNCSAVIMPSFYEGCSNVICEAMACGKPVLASRIGDNYRFVKNGQNGYLFDPESPHEIADKILEFSYQSSAKKKKMGEMNRKIAEDLFSPEKFVQQYIDIISTLVTKQ